MTEERDRVAFYARVELRDGHPDIEVSAKNYSPRPVWVCRNPHHCFELRIERAPGSWEPWSRRDDPAAPRKEDFILLGPDDGVDLFALPVRPEGNSRAFRFGALHLVTDLPVEAEYDYAYVLGDAARRAAVSWGRVPVFEGPEGMGSTPNRLVTPDNAEVVRRISAGDRGASQYLKPADPSVLPELDRLLRSPGQEVREAALHGLIATRLPEAATLLVRTVEAEEDGQIRSLAVGGFLEIHPESVLEDLLRLAESPAFRQAEFPEALQATIMRAIGLMGNPRHVEVLEGLEKKLVASGSASSFWGPAKFPDARRVSFLMACARLGDKAAASEMLKSLQGREVHELERCLVELPYCRSLDVAEGLMEFFGDTREFTSGPCVQVEPTPEGNATLIEWQERCTFAIRDHALLAITRILPDVDWGFDPLPLRRYSPREFERVRERIRVLRSRRE